MHIIVYRRGEPIRFIDGVRFVERIGLMEPGLCVEHVGGKSQITIGDDIVILRSDDGEVCRFTCEKKKFKVEESRDGRGRPVYQAVPDALADRLDGYVAAYTDRIGSFGQGAGGAFADERIKLVEKIVEDINATYGKRVVANIEEGAPMPLPLGGVAYWAERYIDSIDAEEHANAAAECEYSQDNLRAAVRSLRLGSARERLRHLLLRVQEGGFRDATLVDQVADEITAWMPGQVPDDDAVLAPILTKLILDHNTRCAGIEPVAPGAGVGDQWAEQNRQTLEAIMRVFRAYTDTAANALLEPVKAAPPARPRTDFEVGMDRVHPDDTTGHQHPLDPVNQPECGACGDTKKVVRTAIGVMGLHRYAEGFERARAAEAATPCHICCPGESVPPGEPDPTQVERAGPPTPRKNHEDIPF